MICINPRLSFKNKIIDDFFIKFELFSHNKNNEKINRFIFEYRPISIFEIMGNNTK